MAEPVAARKSPYTIDVKAGRTYFRCARGRGKKQPLCDGTHDTL